MEITQEQEIALAASLGITRPACPSEVAEHLKARETYRTALSKFRINTPSSWDTLEKNQADLDEIHRELTKLEKALEAVTEASETVKLATAAYETGLSDYWQAIRDEAQRPRQAFEKDKDEFKATLDKEARSLKRRISLNNSKRWDLKQDSPERLALEGLIAEQQTRLELVEYLSNEIRYITFTVGAVFTEQTILDQVTENSWNTEAILTKLAKLQAEKQTA